MGGTSDIYLSECKVHKLALIPMQGGTVPVECR